ncbi:MAG: hypothetical protein ACM3TN_08080 [Alphaproteobacteria bacterium]
MPSDETRSLLKIFGIAVTTYEDLIQSAASAEQIKEAETQAFNRLTEIKNHMERLRAGAKRGS